MSSTEARERQWVDPFVLPSGMTFRFTLLVVSVIATSAYYLSFIAPPGLASVEAADTRCLSLTGLAGSRKLADASVRDGPYLVTVLARFNQCMAPVDRARAWWILGPLAVVFAVTAITYWLMPAWKIRRDRLVTLAGGQAPQQAALRAALDTLVAEAGLARAPVFLLDPVSPAITGLAFGRLGRYYVRLDAGLVVLRATDPAGFRAVVGHELAHLRHRDVDQTYLTIALWRVFVLLILVVLAVALLLPGRLGYPPNTGVLLAAPATLGTSGPYLAPLVVLVVMVYLTRNAILRSRELYADLRVAGPGTGGDLARLLTPAPGAPGTVLAEVRRLLSRHPGAAARRAAAADPGRLFRFGFWEAAAVGGAVSLIYAVLVVALFRFSQPIGAGFGVPALLLAGTAGGLITLAQWRSTTYALVSQGTAPDMLRPAAGLWAGLVVIAAVLVKPVPLAQSAPAAAVTGAALAMAAGWTAAVATAWLPAVRGRSLRWAWPGAAVAGSVVIAAVFELWLAPDGVRGVYPVSNIVQAGAHARAAAIGWAGPRWLWDLAFLPTVTGAAAIRLGFIALLLIAAVPLAAWAWATPAAAPDWQRRALPRDHDPVPIPRGRVGIGPALTAGAVAGVLAIASQFVLRAALHASLPLAVRRADIMALLLTYWDLGIAVLAQAAAATVVAATARRSAVVLAMLAAAIAAGLAALGTVASARVGSCVALFSVRPAPCAIRPDGGFVALILQLTVLEGGAAALLAAAVAVVIRATLRRLANHGAAGVSGHQRTAPPEPAPPPAQHGRTRKVTIVGVAATMAAATVTAWLGPGSGPGSAASTALVSPVNPAAAVATWWSVGGKNLAGALIHDEGAMIGNKGKPDSVSALRSACSAALADATRAMSFAPVPDTAIQKLWHTSATQFRLGAGECLTALSGTGDPTASARAVTNVGNGAKALDQVLSAIHAIAHV